MTKIRNWFGLIFFSFISLFALLLAGITEALPFYVPTYAYLIFALIFLGLLFPFLRDNKSKAKYAVPCLFLSGLVLLYFSSWSSRKLFLQDLYSISPGMSVQQVEKIMARYKTFSQPNTRISTTGELVLLDANIAGYKHAEGDNADYNGDTGIIRFKNNKVSSVEFSPD